MALLAIIYWCGASADPIDRSVMDLSVPYGARDRRPRPLVCALGWLDLRLRCAASVKHELALSVVTLRACIVAAGLGLRVRCSARAPPIIHVGAMIGTIMAWNVYFVIIPAQRKLVEAKERNEAPDPVYGLQGKQRSVHNTYFTLPVLFIMISNHYPMTYGSKYNWAILAVFLLSGALIRQYFVLRHVGKNLVWLPAAGTAMLVILAIAIAPKPAATGAPAAAAKTIGFAEVQPIIKERCAVCHSEKPTFAGFVQPPGGVVFDTPEQVKAAAPRIHQQTVATQAMPIGNLTKMTDAERALLVAGDYRPE